MSQETHLSLKIKIKQINERCIIYCTLPDAIGFKSVDLIQTELRKFQQSTISNCKLTTLSNEINRVDYVRTHVDILMISTEPATNFSNASNLPVSYY